MSELKDVKNGQVIQITVREDNGLCYWMYAVANNIFDDRIEFLKKMVQDICIYSQYMKMR